MTLWPTAPEPAPPPSLDPTRPNPQGREGRTGEQTRIPRSASTAQRKHLVAIAVDRLTLLEAAGERSTRDARGRVQGSALHGLWQGLHDGWASCGWSTLYRNAHTGTVVGLPDHCDKPLCPYDEQRRVGRLRDRYRARHDLALADRRLYLAVLTIPNVAPGELAAAFDQLRDALGKLRRRKWWIEAVAGGLWRLEVTVNLDTDTWHPHVNLLFETRAPIRMADWQPRLQAEWRSVLGAPDQQWVWLMPGWSGALPEAIKRQVKITRQQLPTEADGASSMSYTVKAPKAPDWIDAGDARWVIEYVEGQAGRRSVSSFGAWRGLPQPKAVGADEPTVEAPWAPGEDFWATRRLPMYDPTLPIGSKPADWQHVGRGPRWTLKPFKPPGTGRAEWLVWQPGDGPEPANADDDLALMYAMRLPLPRAGPPA